MAVIIASRAAEFSACGEYRYRLDRRLQGPMGAGTLVFVMLNPSTADAFQEDATIRRCLGYAAAWNYGRLVVVNLFAYRSTDPAGLKRTIDPVGPLNDEVIVEACSPQIPCKVILAWGAKGDYLGRAERVMAMLRERCGSNLYALAITGHGQPGHPLRLPADLKPIAV